MKFYTVEIKGKEEILVGFEDETRAYRIAEFGLHYQDMNDLVVNLTDAEKYILTVRYQAFDAIKLSDVKVLAPIPRPRQDIVCLGINYAEHAVEASRFSDKDFGGERPYTIYFSKRVNEAVAPNGGIQAHAGLVTSLDYEVELAVILGKDALNVAVEDAKDYIFGYTIINDVSARNLQTRHKQWYLGKSLDGFTPMGPCIVTKETIGDVENLNICSKVNGNLRQNSNTKNMICKIAEAIAELSKGMTLQAGTIIATGTPSGVGMGMTPPTFLQIGDVVRCEIENIGVLENRIID